jgi:hypothetical protein
VSGLAIYRGEDVDGAPEPLVNLDKIRSGGPPPDGIPSIDPEVHRCRRRRFPGGERAGVGGRRGRHDLVTGGRSSGMESSGGMLASGGVACQRLDGPSLVRLVRRGMMSRCRRHEASISVDLRSSGS